MNAPLRNDEAPCDRGFEGHQETTPTEYASVPDTIKALRRFVLWRSEPNPKGGKPSKVPYYANGARRSGEHGSPADVANLVTFNDALEIVARGGYSGIGVAMLPGNDLTGLDFDHCIDALGNIAPDVLELVAGTYAEISPSGTGIRAFFSGTMPTGHTNEKNHDGGLELFTTKGYVTLTGRAINGSALAPLTPERAKAIAGRLGSAKASKTNAERLNEAIAADPVVLRLRELGTFENALSGGRIAFVCPFEDEHTSGAAAADTVYFMPFYDGRTRGHFHCSHAHCAKRTQEEYHQALEINSAAASGVDIEGAFANADTGEGEVVADSDLPARLIRNLPGISIVHGDVANGIEPLTDAGNAQRVKRYLDGLAKYIPETDTFLFFNNGAYRHDVGDALVTQEILRLPGDLYQQARRLLESGARQEEVIPVVKAAATVQSRPKIDAVRGLLARDPDLTLHIMSLDAEPLLVGFDGGRQVIEIATGRIRPATFDDYVTKSLGVAEIGRSEDAATWRAFLAAVFEDDPEMIRFIKRLVGYCLTGSTVEQILVFLWGSGANGKSTFVELLRHLLGDYARAISTDALMAKQGDGGGATPDLARTVGARVVFGAETEENHYLAESLVKSLTGGDLITARHLYREPFEFVPSFKLILSGNHRPLIRGTDHGIWRRIRLIPFVRTFKADEADPEMLNKLKAEAPHIMAWALEGACEWVKHRLGPVPARISTATADYRHSQDTIGEFLAEKCDLSDPSAFTSSASLFMSFKFWSESCGLKPPTRQSFGRRLTERPGFVPAMRGEGRERGFLGVKLAAAEVF